MEHIFSRRHHRRSTDIPDADQSEHHHHGRHDDDDTIVVVVDDDEGTSNNKQRGGIVSVTLQDSQQVDLTAVFTDAAGQPDTTGDVAWTVDRPDVVALSATTGNTTTAAAGVPGDAQITATKTDTDGTTFALPPCGISVVAGDATGGQITAGTPVAKGTATAPPAGAATPAPADGAPGSAPATQPPVVGAAGSSPDLSTPPVA